MGDLHNTIIKFNQAKLNDRLNGHNYVIKVS